MTALALSVVVCGFWPAQTADRNNLDFHTGTLAGWHGRGFYVTTADHRGPSLSVGVCSSDGGTPERTGLRRYTFAVGPDGGLLRCSAYAALGKGCKSDGRLDVLVLTADSVPVPKQVKTESGWRLTTGLLPRLHGRPREYRWDLSELGGQVVQIVLLDRDGRPGCHLFCSGFHLAPTGELDGQEFAEQVRQLERRHNLPPLVRYDTRNFTAWSNAEETFTTARLRNCEVMYRLFCDHFRRRGFAVHPPGSRLLVAVFDSQAGFEAYLGQKVPSGITGIYNRDSNRLLLYDLNQNNAVLAGRDKALQDSRKIPLDLDRIRYVEAVQRQAQDFSHDGSLSTAMHETAHHLSFNCGLLNRHGDVPLWLCEGLACYCEATDQGGWQGIGELNPGRISDLANVLRRGGRFLSLRSLVEDDDWRQNTNKAVLGYAQSWALFRMLMEERPAALRAYLTLIRPRRTSDHRLTDFCEVFGADLAGLERHYQEYLHQLVQRHAPPAAR